MDYEKIMLVNHERVSVERDASRRPEAIRELYAQDAELHEPQSVWGHDAITQAVTDQLALLPPEFTFTAIRPAVDHNGLGRLQWSAGPPGGPVALPAPMSRSLSAGSSGLSMSSLTNRTPDR